MTPATMTPAPAALTPNQYQRIRLALDAADRIAPQWRWRLLSDALSDPERAALIEWAKAGLRRDGERRPA